MHLDNGFAPRSRLYAVESIGLSNAKRHEELTCAAILELTGSILRACAGRC